MPTKVASYLTELGFKELDYASNASSYNKENAGQYIIVKEFNRMYRYEPNSSAVVDGIRVLDSSVEGAKWVSVGGSAMTQERVTSTTSVEGRELLFGGGRVVGIKDEILYVNIGNTQVLSENYNVGNVNGPASAGNPAPYDRVILTQSTQIIPAGTPYEIMLFTGNVEGADDTDYSKLPATLYQNMAEVSGNTIALDSNHTIYKKTVASAVTLNFTMPSDYSSSLGVLTFELYIDMTTASSILWTPTISWNGGTAPLFNAVKKYLLSFRTFDGGTTWIGNLEMEW